MEDNFSIMTFLIRIALTNTSSLVVSLSKLCIHDINHRDFSFWTLRWSHTTRWCKWRRLSQTWAIWIRPWWWWRSLLRWNIKCRFLQDVFHVIIIKVHSETLFMDVASNLSGCPYSIVCGMINFPKFLH